MHVATGRYECKAGGRSAFYSVVPDAGGRTYSVFWGKIGATAQKQDGLDAYEVDERISKKLHEKGYVWVDNSPGDEVVRVIGVAAAKAGSAKKASPIPAAKPTAPPVVKKTPSEILSAACGKIEPGTGVAFGKVCLEKTEGYQHVPAVNGAYLFPKHVQQVALDIREHSNLMFVGHTGCGKTSCVEQMAARLGQGVLRVNMNGQMSVGDFVGLWTVKGAETVWVDGALPLAMREGYWLIVDEIDFAEPAILAALNAVLEPGGMLYLKEKGHEAIVPHERFRVFATANTVGCMQDFRSMYQGTNIMNEAFLDRWRVYHVNYLSAKEEAKVLVASIPGMVSELASAFVQVAGLIREAGRKEQVECTFSLRRLIDWARVSLRGGSAMEGAESTILSKISAEDAKLVREIIQRVMG